jgi:acetyl-CoA carboxylase biotin carboxyl carrier protein
MNEREIKKLIRIVEQSQIHELEITEGEQHIRIAKAPPAGAVAPVPAAATPEPPPRPTEASPSPPATAPQGPPSPEEDGLRPVVAPIVGTFYASPAPDAAPFVQPGARVEVGQTVCIIEAMKVMNPIGAEFAGVVRRVLVENAQPVEYGEPLFLIEPDQA